MNDLVNYQGQVPARPEDMANVYNQYTDAYTSSERGGGQSITMRNGVMSVGDQPIPGNQFAAIILDAVRLNTFYMSPFNPQNPMPPECYAIGREDGEMAPHPDMAKDTTYFKKQFDFCSGCPHNQFGSSRTGVGKACSNRRRLLLLPAGQYMQVQGGFQLQPITDINHYDSAPMLTMNLAPTSLTDWGKWVRKTGADFQRPPFGVIARVYLYAHPKHGKEAIGFETIAPVPDDWGPTIYKRHVEAVQEIFEGYESPTARGQNPQAQAQQQAPAPGGFYQAQGNVNG